MSKDTIPRITDPVSTELAEWMARPLEKVYAAVFIDAICVKVRDGQVANRPSYAAIVVDLAAHKDVLGLWAGPAVESWRSSGCSCSPSWRTEASPT